MKSATSTETAKKWWWPFRAKPKPDIKPGDIFTYHSRDQSPWPVTGRWQVEVLDIRNGWVRYRFLETPMFQDERLRMSDECRQCGCWSRTEGCCKSVRSATAATRREVWLDAFVATCASQAFTREQIREEAEGIIAGKGVYARR